MTNTHNATTKNQQQATKHHRHHHHHHHHQQDQHQHHINVNVNTNISDNRKKKKKKKKKQKGSKNRGKRSLQSRRHKCRQQLPFSAKGTSTKGSNSSIDVFGNSSLLSASQELQQRKEMNKNINTSFRERGTYLDSNI